MRPGSVEDAVKSMQHRVLPPVVQLRLNPVKKRNCILIYPDISTYLLLETLIPYASWSSGRLEKAHSRPPWNSWENLNWRGNSRKGLEGWTSEDGISCRGLRWIWDKVGHITPAWELRWLCETIFVPLEDGDGCGIVEKHLIHVIVLFTDCKTTTEVNVTMVRVGSDKESIC